MLSPFKKKLKTTFLVLINSCAILSLHAINAVSAVITSAPLPLGCCLHGALSTLVARSMSSFQPLLLPD